MLVGGGKALISDGVIGDLLGQIIEPLFKGIASGDYTEYNDIIVNALVADMGKFGLDENGEASNGSGNACYRDYPTNNRKSGNGEYHIHTYSLVYDWRLDPFVTAAELNDYIKMVKKATGFDKVNIVGRCLGANIVLTYLSEYGYDDVNAVSFYIAGFEGFEYVTSLYTGEIDVDTDALTRWFYQMSIESDDDELISFLKAFVAIINAINGLSLPLDVLYTIYDQVYTDIIPRVLIESFGSMPAFWSVVDDDKFEAAKELCFSTPEEQQKYAKLIEKIDKYHNQIGTRKDEILDNAIASGVNVYFFGKYGFTAAPLNERSGIHGDGTVSITSQTFGATSTEMGKTFSKSYLEKAEENGTLKYISPDKCIDASTAYAPDHTWIVKGSNHGIMPTGLEMLMAAVLDANGMREHYVTVDDLEEYPQYLYLESTDVNAPMHPLTEENAFIGDERWNYNIFEQLTFFFEKVFSFITEFLNTILEVINNTEI